jgi:hypothetical protein
MQTKSSYRVLKWTLLLGTAASMATACVVTTSGDGGNVGGDISFAGDGTSTSGKTSGAGTTSTAGKASTGGGGTGGSTGGTSTTTAGTAAGGQGEGGAAYVPGLCQVDDPTPTSLPSCDPNPDRDTGQPCKICMKAQCCTDWQTCYGEMPTTACGYGATADAPGQFDCIQGCYMDTPNASDDVLGTLQTCESKCLNQCAEKDTDGFALTDTEALMGCAQDHCLAECFP